MAGVPLAPADFEAGFWASAVSFIVCKYNGPDGQVLKWPVIPGW